MTDMKVPKKLIEVALPLDDINDACAYEKMPGIGAHPRGIHLWWARRPLAAARAVLFAQLVNDPGYERSTGRGLNKEKAAIERERLFDLIRRLVLWENSTNEQLLREAREEISKSWRETCELNRNHPQAADLFNPNDLPAFHDPFAGGGAIPLEAQRLGLESYASDLNPVPVVINKAMIEIPPRFAAKPPVGPIHPTNRNRQLAFHSDWSGAKGIAEDMRRYGGWIHEEAEKRIGNLYPKIEITEDMAADRPDLRKYIGKKLTIIAWIWARTIKSPNPACSNAEVPLVSSFVLSTKNEKQAWVEPVVVRDTYQFYVKVGDAPAHADAGTRAGGRGAFRCLCSDTPIDGKYIKREGQAGRLSARLMAIVAEGTRERVYLSPTLEHEQLAKSALPVWRPEIEFSKNSRHMTPWVYGLSKFGDLFSNRQLLALNTFSELIAEATQKVYQDALANGMKDDGVRLEDGGFGAKAYAEALGVFLSFGISRIADFNNALCRWNPSNQKVMNLFGRQAVPMVWDYAEANVLAEVVGGWPSICEWQASCVETLCGTSPGYVLQCDAATQQISKGKIVSTDPPYYDNVPYADLSDFFYVWLRKSIKDSYPNLFATLAVPKADELVADSFRHNTKEDADAFFLKGMTHAMHNIAEQAHLAFPVTIYYAFKQSETKGESGTSSTGWETFLEAVLSAGFTITGTWPLRSEQSSRMRGMDSNALASSIVLVCRKRSSDAPTISRREFIRELNAVLPDALDEMTRGGINSPVAPVDLSQAIIGPGMAIFSKFKVVLEADGKPMTVRTALQLINRFLAEDDFDHDSQFCLHWFETQGWAGGKYGEAEVLARAKGTSIAGVTDAGVLESGKGSVRLLRYGEYPDDWSPEKDNRTPIWEALHFLIRALQNKGESAAGALLARMPERGEPIRQLAYRLYTLCERKGWSEDARAYNELITSWQSIEAASQEAGPIGEQRVLDF